jgi:hypothetical protein
MLAFMKKIIESVISKGIYDAIKYLFVIAFAGIASLAALIISTNTKYLIPYASIITITAAAAAILLVLFIYKGVSPIYNFYIETDFKYVFLEKEYFYEYIDKEHITYKKILTLKVLCKSLDRYYDKYNWTGGYAPVITSEDKNHKIVLTTARDSFQQFEVLFGRKYKKGEVIKITLTFDLKNSENKATPAISSTIVEPTKHLTFHIKISKDYRKGAATAQKFPITDSRIALESTEMKFDSEGEIIWPIANPQMLLVYSLSWEAPEEKNN